MERRASHVSEAGGGYFYPDDEDDEYRQSTTACCPRQTIPDSCSCPEGCECSCMDCDCWTTLLDGDDDE